MIWKLFSSGNKYPETAINDEDGFVDLSFNISKHEKDADGFFTIFTQGKLKDRNVGFAVEIFPYWEPRQIEDTDDFFYWGEVSFINTGKDTENFINTLSELYKTKLPELNTPQKVYAQAVGLACNPELLESEPIKMKLFFNPDGDEDLYSEVFVNIDLANNLLEFNEKDMDYRQPLICSLAN